MTPTTRPYDIEASRAAALQIAVLALEQANAAKGIAPLQAGAFRSILATARGLIAQADIQLAEIAASRESLT